MRHSLKFNSIFRTMFLSLLGTLWGASISAQPSSKLKDFRGTPQTVALLGAFSEFVDPELKLRIVSQTRRVINKFTRSFGDSSVSNFKLALNPNDQFFRPITGVISENQKQFFKSAQKDNSVDIFALAALTETGEGLDLEMQLFDARIETLSGLEKVIFKRGQEERALEDLVYRLMNYIDREGFVHPDVQDVLEKPLLLQTKNFMASPDSGGREFSINPEDLGGSGSLAGKVAIGGDKTPFWESWWFWTIVGGGLASAGGLTYYFLVVDEPPSRGNVIFRAP